MVRKGIATGLIALLLAGTPGCATKNDTVVETPTPVPTQTTVRVDYDSLKKVASAKTGLEPEKFEVNINNYHGDEFPFRWAVEGGFLGGDYLVASNSDDSVLAFFSKSGDFIGTVRAAGENKWLATRTDNEDNVVWQRLYGRAKDGHRETIYVEEHLPDGRILRGFDSMTMDLGGHPVYRIEGEKLVPDRIYRGPYGGDSQHLLHDRGPGKYFAVQSELRTQEGIVLRQYGEVFNIESDSRYVYGDVSASASLSSGKLHYLQTGENLDHKDLGQFNQIVPKALQGPGIDTSYAGIGRF